MKLKNRSGVLIFQVIFGLAVFTPVAIGQVQAPTSQSADEAILRELTTRYYYDFEKPTLDDQFALWSPRSTDDSSKREQMERVFAQYDKVKVEKLTIDRVKVTGETAIVRVTVHVSGVSKRTGQPLRGWMGRDAKLTHKLVRENGTWLLMQTMGSEEHLAEDVTQAKAPEEREALLDRDKDLINIGFIYDLGAEALRRVGNNDYPKALDVVRLALRLAEENGDKELIANTLSYLGEVYTRLGDHGQVLLCYLRYLQLNEELGDKGNPANARNSVGIAFSVLGDYPRAIDYYERSLQTKTLRPRSPEGEGRVLGNIGRSFFDSGDYAMARQTFERLLALAEKNKLQREVSRAYVGLGEIKNSEGHYSDALEYFLRALQINEELKTKGSNQLVLKKIAESYRLLGNYHEAARYAELAVNSSAEMGVRDLTWDAQVTAGRAYIGLKQPERARLAFDDAIKTVEAMRGRALGAEDAQQRFFENKASPYQAMTELFISQGKGGEALAFAETAKARVLLGLLKGSRSSASKSMTAAEKLEELQLLAKLASLNTAVTVESQKPQVDQKRFDDVRGQLEKARLEHEAFRTRLFIEHPELRVQRGEMMPVTLEDAAALLPNDKAAIAEYVVAGDKTFLFVITKHISGKASLRVSSIDIKDEDLGKRVEVYRSKLASGDLDFQKTSRELYDLLLKPAQAQLAGKNNIIIVPDGSLWDLPFPALRNEKGQYLVEQAAVSYAPSLTALKEMSKKAKARKPDAGLELVAFGNPIVAKTTSDRVKQVFMGEKLEPLPESERLVNELGKMYGATRSKVYVGDRAREEVAKTEAPKYRVVQFATHGILNNVSPMYSHLVLAQNDKNPNEDGLLEAWEMKDLDLKADMVILSACDTARGRISNGEGVIGMSWALFIAGTPTTVASQWKVESKSTTELMLEFHRQLLTAKGISKAEALRRAELKVMKMPGYRHPSYWAGFVIVGDGS